MIYMWLNYTMIMHFICFFLNMSKYFLDFCISCLSYLAFFGTPAMEKSGNRSIVDIMDKVEKKPWYQELQDFSVSVTPLALAYPMN